MRYLLGSWSAISNLIRGGLPDRVNPKLFEKQPSFTHRITLVYKILGWKVPNVLVVIQISLGNIARQQ